LLFNHNAIVEGSIPAYLGLWCVHMPFAFFAFYLCRQIDSPRKV
jgi:lipopolysaccharide export LptBFGC system permease protein LptF